MVAPEVLNALSSRNSQEAEVAVQIPAILPQTQVTVWSS